MKSFKEWYEYCLSKSTLHEDSASLPQNAPDNSPLSIIAYYLPQFHPIAENNDWWGEGFTEWTNVTRALPRYVGHYQPRRPGAFGYYDLDSIDVLRKQVALAKRGGISGFCFHYYWFSGKRLLHKPLDNLLADKTIDFKFCINWANESWTRRWDGGDTAVLMEQCYHEGGADNLADDLLPVLRDPRYITINSRPLIMIYRPDHIVDPASFFGRFRARLRYHGLPNPFIIAADAFDVDPSRFDLDGLAGFPPHGGGSEIPSDLHSLELLDLDARGGALSYDSLAERLLRNRSGEVPLFPGVCPNWDNEARRGVEGTSLYGSTPAKYGYWLHQAALAALADASAPEKLVFVNAWNEWAEGAYLEPDRHFGYAYLAETRRVLERVIASEPPIEPASNGPFKSRRAARLNKVRRLNAKVTKRLQKLWRY